MKDFTSVITLVHGTFAKKASWTRKDSSFCAALQRTLPGPVLFKTFEWSGKNSHRARLEAGTQLAELVAELLTTYPHSKHCIVGHSHGGNVILYAVSSREIFKKVSCVVSLATPFIVARPRELKTILNILRYIFRFGVFVPWVCGAFLFAASSAGLLGVGAIIVFVPIAAMLTYALWKIDKWWFVYLQRNLPQLLQSRSQEIVRRVSVAVPHDLPLLIVRNRKDEAYEYLTILDKISEAPSHLWRPKFYIWSAGITTGLLVAFSAYYVTTDISEDSWVRVGTFGFMLFITPLIAALSFLFVALISQLVMVVWMKLFRGSPLGYGDKFFENWLAHISTAMRPPEERSYAEKEYSLSGHGLRHSMLYTNEHVIRDVAEWMGRVFKGSDTTA